MMIITEDDKGTKNCFEKPLNIDELADEIKKYENT